jgi:hypothetical protein
VAFGAGISLFSGVRIERMGSLEPGFRCGTVEPSRSGLDNPASFPPHVHLYRHPRRVHAENS